MFKSEGPGRVLACGDDGSQPLACGPEAALDTRYAPPRRSRATAEDERLFSSIFVGFDRRGVSDLSLPRPTPRPARPPHPPTPAPPTLPALLFLSSSFSLSFSRLLPDERSVRSARSTSIAPTPPPRQRKTTDPQTFFPMLRRRSQSVIARNGTVPCSSERGALYGARTSRD